MADSPSQELGYHPDQGQGIAPASQPAKSTPETDDRTKFPYPAEIGRINNYNFHEKLFFGNHFEAFRMKIESEAFGREYAKLRYVVANFPGLISRIIADLLFIEPPKIKVEDGDQDWVDELLSENKIRTLNYESALANSYFGDNLYKIRIGKRKPTDKKTTIIIEEQTPLVYNPKINQFNVKGEPEEQELSWAIKVDDKEYLRKEIHEPGKIYSKAFNLQDGKIGTEVSLDTIGVQGVKSEEVTQIDRSLLIHVPNWRAGNKNRVFGISDYNDLETLFFGINNRMTKIANVLDTHSDPILALPDGIVDEKGKVRKSKLGLFVRPEGADDKTDPKYITWDANLEWAFKEIEKMVEMTFMMSETSPDILGMGQGQAESGRALKLKLLRTLAKAQRKQLYYREALIEVVYVAQLLGKAWGIEFNGKKLQKDPVKPEIVWSDGLPADMTELIDEETKRIDAGLTTKTDSIMRLDDVDEDTAKKKAEEIKKESELAMPAMNTAANANGFMKNIPGNPGKNEPAPVKPVPNGQVK